MIEVNAKFTKRYIKVNGHVYQLRKADIDIFMSALQISKKYKDINVNDPDAVYAAMEEMKAYIDGVLGPGALDEISEGVPACFDDLVENIVLIGDAAYAAYSEKGLKGYEEDANH